MIHSDTPSIASSLLYKAASNCKTAFSGRKRSAWELTTHQMIRGLFETGQHKHRVLHLGYTETSNAQYFALRSVGIDKYGNRSDPRRSLVGIWPYLVRHDVSEKHDMSWVDTHTVRLHGMLDFVVNCPASGFDAEHFGHIHYVVRPRLGADDACELAC